MILHPATADRRSLLSLIPMFMVVMLAMVPSAVQAALDAHKVLQITPADMPAISGLRISSLHVATVRQGRLVPVPFQIDEYNTAGLPWFASVDVPIKGREAYYDADDRLLVVAGDASAERLPTDAALPPGYLGELSLTLQGETRYLHMISGDFPRSGVTYVRHDTATGITETPFYTLRVDPRNELNWQHLMVRSWRGDQSRSLVDTLKMRIAGGVFTALTRMTLDNDNLRPRVIGVRAGPIRAVMQVETTVVFAGVPVMRMQVQVHRYPRFFEAYTHARIPKLYRKALVDPEVRVTLDGNNLHGAQVRTARSSGVAAKVDGRMDDAERAMVARGLSSSEDWILFDSRNGFSLLTFLDVPPELQGIPLQLVYEDDVKRNDKPERVPGQGPNLGYGIRGFPPGEDFRFGVTLAFDIDLADVDPVDYVARWRERPVYGFRSVVVN